MSERAQQNLKAREGASERRDEDEPVAREAAQQALNDRKDMASGNTPLTALFTAAEAEQFRTRWVGLQAGFVDAPRRVVEQADSLVAEVMKRLTDQFTETRENLEAQWGGSKDASTEDLRVAVQRYRSFFERLLAA